MTMIIDHDTPDRFATALLAKLGVDAGHVAAGSVSANHVVGDATVHITWTGIAHMPADEFHEWLKRLEAKGELAEGEA